MHFRHLDTVSLLVGLAVLAVAALAVVLATRGRRCVLADLARPPVAGKLVSSLSPVRRRLRQWLFFAGLACLLLALARPWWGTRLTSAPRHSRDLLFAVDVSRSMLARDVPPSRLEHAKWFVREVARRSPGDRFGLIAFAGDAMLECPLTQDINTLFQFLDTLDTRSAAIGGTNLATALDVARQACAGAESGHRAVLLLSDGEELEGHAATETAYFKEQGIPLFVVGIGDPAAGSMIQLTDGAFVRDAAGKMVASKLNESGLRALAEATGGIYVRSTALDANVGPVEARVKSLVPSEHVGGTRQAPIERFQWPLALGLLCLLARLLLGERRPASRPAPPAVAALAAVLGAALLTTGDAWGQTAPPAPALMPPLTATAPAATSATPANAKADAETQRRRQEENQQAIAALTNELAKAPAAQQARLHYNLGCRYQVAGDNPRARQEYEAALAAAADQPLVRGFAQQNLGVLRHHEARELLARDPKGAITGLESARQWYREALRLLPGNEIPAANLERLEHDIETAKQLEQFMKQFQQQLEQARQETAKAAEAQAAANQPPPNQDAKSPPQKDAGQQKDADNRQDAANRQTQASQKAVETLVNQSGKNLKPEAAQQFQQAADQIRQAAVQQQQRQGPRNDTGKQAAGQQAEQHLRQAVKLLGGEQPPPDQQQQSGQPKPQDQPKDGKDQKKPDSQSQPSDQQKPDQKEKRDGAQNQGQQKDKQPDQAGQPQAGEEFSLSQTGTDGKKPETAKSGTAGKEEKAIDPNQAAALMQGMLEQEKELREAIKEQRRSTQPEPDKDW